jgi:hypothetical protein
VPQVAVYEVLVMVVVVGSKPDQGVCDRVAGDLTQQDEGQGEHSGRQREGAALSPVRPIIHVRIVPLSEESHVL